MRKLTIGHNRFFVQTPLLNQEKIRIEGESVFQIANVLRLTPGSRVALLDGSGKEYEAILNKVSSSFVDATITGCSDSIMELPIKLTLAIGRPKHPKVETIIQKCTEIGASHFITVECNHSIGDIPDSKRIYRWQKIAIEAVEQCGGAVVPIIDTGFTVDRLISIFPQYNLVLLAHEQDIRLSVINVISNSNLQSLDSISVMLITGPEGGFTDDEVLAMSNGGAIPINLGKRILRAETAAIAGCALIAGVLSQ